MKEDPTRQVADQGWSARGSLTLPEELLLLRVAWLGRNGRGASRDRMVLGNRAVAAARLTELVLAKRTTVLLERRREVGVAVIDATPIGDALLDEVLQRLDNADVRSCAYWIKRIAKGSEVAYWDRLVARSLLRPASLGGEGSRAVADPDAVAAATGRIEAVLAGAERVELRDVALVSLLVPTQGLYGWLHKVELNPSRLVRGYLAHRRDDRIGGEALRNYQRRIESAAELDNTQRDWASAAAHAIERIVWVLQEEP